MTEPRDLQEHETREPYYRISTTILGKFLFLLLIVLVPGFIVQAGIYYDRFQERRAQEFGANLEVARAVAKSLETFTRTILHEELAIGTAFTFPQPLQTEYMQRILDSCKMDYPALADLAWVSPEGRVAVSTCRTSVGIDIHDRPYFREVAGGTEKVVSDLLISRTTGQPVFTISRGIRDGRGGLLGVMLAVVKGESLEELLSIDRPGEGSISIIDSKGMTVCRYPEIEWTWEERNWLKSYPKIKEALGAREVTTDLVTLFDGKKRVAAFAPVGSTGWVVCADRTEEEALAPIVSHIFQQAGLFASVAIGAFWVALAISRRISTPLRKLQAHALALGRGELERQVEIEGPAELQDLAQTFGKMVKEIGSREEALQKARDELEIRVQDRTAELTRANELLKGEIAGRRRTEESLRESEERFRSLFEKSLATMLLIDPETGAIEDANPAAAAFYGYSIDELRTMKITDINLLPKEKIFEAMRMTECEQQNLFHFKHRLATGDIRDVHACSNPMSIGGKRRLYSIIQDITQQKQAEEALRESEARLRSILDHSPAIIYIKDLEGRYVLINRACERMLGAKDEEIRGKTAHEVLPVEIADQCVANDRRVIEKLTPMEVEEIIPQIDGLLVLLSIQFPLLDTSGEPYAICGISTDITHRKKTEDALRESENELRSLSSRLLCAQEEERKRIAVDLHDSIGSSLSAIKMFLETTVHRMREGSATVESVEPIVSMIQETLNETRRIMANLRPSILDDLGVVKTIGWFCRDFRLIYLGVRVEEQIEIEEGDIPDPIKIVIFRVMQEAFHNIARHSKAEQASISLVKRDHGVHGVIELNIEDNGVGFDFDSVRSRKGCQGGMGLPGMRERVELSGGILIIESETGKGTLVKATWPYAGRSRTIADTA